jgi:hypothetical protein
VCKFLSIIEGIPVTSSNRPPTRSFERVDAHLAMDSEQDYGRQSFKHTSFVLSYQKFISRNFELEVENSFSPQSYHSNHTHNLKFDIKTTVTASDLR